MYRLHVLCLSLHFIFLLHLVGERNSGKREGGRVTNKYLGRVCRVVVFLKKSSNATRLSYLRIFTNPTVSEILCKIL